VTGYCRGGVSRQTALAPGAIERQTKMIDEPPRLRDCYVIGGGLPQARATLRGRMFSDGMWRFLPHAVPAKSVAIEALHPMYAADRGCIRRSPRR